MGDRFPFGLPTGWFVVATSDEVKPGDVLSRRYFEREIVIYRTRSGILSVVDAFCPHMGAHLGKVGTVQGEQLRCGFHGFQFGPDGGCVAIAYDSPPPARARLSQWEVREQNGLILVWFDSLGRTPSWEVPPLAEERWSSALTKRYQIDTHPQETTENSVDFGHFTQLHGFVDGEMVGRLETTGPVLTNSYAAYRQYGLPGLPPIRIRVEYDVRVIGLGYSQVDIRLPALRWKLRAWVLPVPLDDEHIDLLIGMAADKSMGPLWRLARRVGISVLSKEVEQDLAVWEHKIFNPTPALAKGDGPVAAYRSWVKQFYAEEY